ncbi:DUF6933 domain-containing protein [Leptothrix sp. BB-4]
MFALRCTKKLLDRLPKGSAIEPEPPTTVLGDWYANLVYTGSQQHVICISERTLLPVVVAAKDAPSLPARMTAALADVLEAVGVSRLDIDAELAEMRSTCFAKTANRRVLGTLNDFAFMFQVHGAHHPKMSLMERTLSLAHTPCGAIDHAFPDDATRAAFATRRLLKSVGAAGGA